MEIERVNEYTIKFFITYHDIETRGFDKEEIWQNRERGEELFWEMMDEAHQQEQFSLEGPLWIQVQALDKGLEILVTRASLSQDGSKLELPISEDKQVDVPVDDNIEKMLDHHFSADDDSDDATVEPEDGDFLSFMLRFSDIEDVISLSHSVVTNSFTDSLYHYEGKYYLYVTFYDSFSESEQDDVLSRMLEFGDETELTVHRIEEYGKVILSEDALGQMNNYFPEK
ncbi:adaptor protein MecA [Pseudalkalibacillus berkeleyi]|uniref:Adapter protein MecA n=1 Tax=Pseudalkalibacillus berkeleyi TaxID=1069813 RepID=A0ABS9GVZ3_9BACL|nr:adaptor protein MecA [Pseudalkalibacillus berkeleyi]MCF6136854.1 adaptor protein MecA [Pseudalkalibacillus berkeleyi]